MSYAMIFHPLLLQVYKTLIISDSQEEDPLGRRYRSKEMTLTDHGLPVTTNWKRDRSSHRVGIQPKERVNDSFEEPSPTSSSASINSNDSIEEKRDDEKGGTRQRRDGLREGGRTSPTESAATQKLHKLQEFILDSGIIQLDDRICMKNDPLDENSSESKIDLQPSDEIQQPDPFDQQDIKKKSTGAVPVERETISVQLSDEKASLTEDVNLHSRQNSDQQQPLVVELAYDDFQIDGQQSLDSQCSVTEKWKRLMDGEGYTPSETQPSLLGQHSGDELLPLFGAVAKSPEKTSLPLSEDSERPSKPLVLLTETTVGEEINSQSEKVISGGDGDRQAGEETHRGLDHDVATAIPPPEATMRGGVHDAMVTFYEFVDKLFTCTAALKSKRCDLPHSMESQMKTARLNKCKTRKKSKKGRKKVTFGDDAQRLSPDTPICERLTFMCY